MNSKERLLAAINREEPDRVPVNLWFTGKIDLMLSPLYGELRTSSGHGLVMSSSPNIGFSYGIPGTPEEYACEWGVRWKRVTNAEGGHYPETIGHSSGRRSCCKWQLE